jgi:putative membrane protein
MLRAIGYLFINVLIVLVLSNLLSNFRVTSWVAAALFIIVLTLLNWTIIPVLKFLTFPLSVLSFGLVSLLINLVGIIVAANLLSNNGVSLAGDFLSQLFSALIISIALAIGQVVVNSVLGDQE